MQVKAGVKDAFRKAPDRAMVKVRAKAILKMSIELHPRSTYAKCHQLIAGACIAHLVHSE